MIDQLNVESAFVPFVPFVPTDNDNDEKKNAMCAVRTDTVPAPRAHLSLLQTFAVKVACAGTSY